MLSHFEFDGQAEAFDERAGLPRGGVERVAQALLEYAGAGPVLDLGAGTGQIGAPLVASLGGGYVAMDRSRPMLMRFAREVPSVQCVVADAERSWPFAAGAFGLVFMARVAHLLTPTHLAQELSRCLRANGTCVIGRRARERDHVRSVLRRALHQALRQRGYEPKGGGRERKDLLHAFGPGRVRAYELQQVASWDSEDTPANALLAWREKSGLAGLDLASSLKDELLSEVEQIARDEYGTLEAPRTGREHYVLERFELT